MIHPLKTEQFDLVWRSDAQIAGLELYLPMSHDKLRVEYRRVFGEITVIITMRAYIAHGVWLYARFNLGLGAVEELMLDRGVDVSCDTIRR